MALSLTIDRTFSPSHSLLGRLIRRRSGDRLRAEALYLFVVTMGVVAWMLVDFAAWALLADRIEAEPTGRVSILFFIAQIGVPLAGVLGAFVGFRPEIRIRLEGDVLAVERGAERLHVTLDEPVTVRTIDATEYHRGLRLLESTRPFINRPVDHVVALVSPDRTVVLGLPPGDRETLLLALPRSASKTAATSGRAARASSELQPTDPTH